MLRKISSKYHEIIPRENIVLLESLPFYAHRRVSLRSCIHEHIKCNESTFVSDGMSCQNTNLITQIVSEGVTHYTVCYTVENHTKLPKLHKNTQVSGLIFDVFWPKISIFEAFLKNINFLKDFQPKKPMKNSRMTDLILRNFQVFEANYRFSWAKMKVRNFVTAKIKITLKWPESHLFCVTITKKS